MKNYGKALKELRKKSNMTQAKLAEELSVTYQTVSKWENNVNTPDISIVEAICKVFGITVDEFLRIAEEGAVNGVAEVSVGKEDAAKICPKCGNIIAERFCSKCGYDVLEKRTAEAGAEEGGGEEVAAKFCPECGVELVGRYCKKCGYDTVEKRTAEERENAVVVPQETEPKKEAEPEKESETEKKPKTERKKLSKKKKLAIIITSVALAVIVIALAIVLPIVLTNRPSKPTVTVGFASGGGVGEMSEVKVTVGEEFTVPECEFTRSGYKFSCWYSGSKRYEAGDKIVFDGVMPVAIFTAVWTTDYVAAFSGDGTASSPYLINNYDKLSKVADFTRTVEGADKAYFKLTADIDCKGGKLDAIFGYGGDGFSGSFDGGYHVIKNVTFSETVGKINHFSGETATYMGLFGFVYNGEIKNVGLSGYQIESSSGKCKFAAPICGHYDTLEPMTECYATGFIELENAYKNELCVGGLVGYNRGIIENCYSDGAIVLSYTKSSGAMVGNNLYVGGFVGKIGYDVFNGVTLKVRNCYSDMQIFVDIDESIPKLNETMYCALFYGYSQGYIEDCFVTDGMNINRYYDDYGNRLLCRNFGAFGADETGTARNVYVSYFTEITFDDTTIFNDAVVLSGERHVTSPNLYSLGWLISNVGFDANIWKETEYRTPVLKHFGK